MTLNGPTALRSGTPELANFYGNPAERGDEDLSVFLLDNRFQSLLLNALFSFHLSMLRDIEVSWSIVGGGSSGSCWMWSNLRMMDSLERKIQYAVLIFSIDQFPQRVECGILVDRESAIGVLCQQ